MQEAGGTVETIVWVDKNVRVPTEEDADEYGTIMALHKLNGVIVTKLYNFERFGSMMDFWAKTPRGPETRR